MFLLTCDPLLRCREGPWIPCCDVMRSDPLMLVGDGLEDMSSGETSPREPSSSARDGNVELVHAGFLPMARRGYRHRTTPLNRPSPLPVAPPSDLQRGESAAGVSDLPVESSFVPRYCYEMVVERLRIAELGLGASNREARNSEEARRQAASDLEASLREHDRLRAVLDMRDATVRQLQRRLQFDADREAELASRELAVEDMLRNRFWSKASLCSRCGAPSVNGGGGADRRVSEAEFPAAARDALPPLVPSHRLRTERRSSPGRSASSLR